MKQFSFLALLVFAAAPAEAGLTGFNPTPEMKPLPADGTFRVFSNGTVCIQGPCPSFTAVSADGVATPVVDVLLPKGSPVADSQALFRGGLLVKGDLTPGDVEIGTPGELVVGKVLARAEMYVAEPLDIVCFQAPCPDIQVTNSTGSTQFMVDVDLSLTDAVLVDIFDKEILVYGFPMSHRSPAGIVESLLVTGVAAERQRMRVMPSGVVCFRAPCETWAVDLESGAQAAATGVGVSFLLMGASAIDTLLATMAGGSFVEGFFVIGPTLPSGTEAVVHLLALSDE